MNIRDLTDRFTVQQKTATADSQGGRATVWTTLTTVWGAYRPLRTGERLRASAIGAETTAQVVIRYRRDVTPEMRLQWTPYKATTPKTLEIHGVTPVDGGREWLALDVAEER